MERTNRPDCVKTATIDGQIQLPIGHYAVISSHYNHNGTEKISIHGLGSCIALIFYDIPNKVGAMAHILLPEAKMSKSSNPQEFPHKYADYSVKDLLSVMLEHGAAKRNIKAVIVGGANIFNDESLAIGKQNVKAVKNQLNLFNIELTKELTEGNKGRILVFNVTDYSISIKLTGDQQFIKHYLK